MTTADLPTFLTARFDEQEEAAERGRPHPDAATFANDNYGYLWVQPTYVLADLAAKRRIVELHTRYEPNAHECPGDFSTFAVAEGAPCPTLRALAQPFADHPDFRPEWKL